MSMVTVEHLHKVFGRFTAVKDASFTIEKGEIVGFLGPNGAGKTTDTHDLDMWTINEQI